MQGLRKILWSYTIILLEAKLLGSIIKHEMCISPIMTKNDNNSRYLFFLRDCPAECVEAVSCVMFAAARFADLPELCDVRNMFIEKYGSSLEAQVNQKVSVITLYL